MAERTNPFLSKSIGNADQRSRAQADQAAERPSREIRRVKTEVPQDSSWPLSPSGSPMVKAEMSAAELIPTGQYANVSVGPARIFFLIDPDRQLQEGETYFSDQQRANMARALNEAAEIVGLDVVGVQRNLVLESIQQQIG